MKTFLVAIAFTGSSFFSSGQNIAVSEVPSVVMNTFKNTFPAALKEDWEKKDNNFEVEFKLGAAEHGAVLDAAGKLLLTKQEVAAAEVPAAINNVIKQEYSRYTLDEAEKIVYNGQVYYEIELSGFILDKEVIFSADGKPASLPF